MNLNKKSWQWALLIVLSFIWGASFILMKKGLRSYSPDQVAAMRIFISFLVLLPFMIPRIKLIDRTNIRPLLIAGFIGNGIPAFLFATAQTRVDSSVAGMLNSLTPLFTLLVGLLLYRTGTRLLNVIGVIIGLIGAFGLIGHPDPSLIPENTPWYSEACILFSAYGRSVSKLFDTGNAYALLIVLATLFYGINVNEVKSRLYNLDGITITALLFLFIGPFAGVYLLFTDFHAAFATENYGLNFMYIFILAFFGSAVAVIGINALIRHASALFASSVTYVIPVFAITWGLIDGESVTLISIASMGIIFLGVYLVNKNGRRTRAM
ncbi:MAG: DMT family transporter [Bacteroidetes bacterium]|nr:DMT family transporter [Bacteroidota bacterium]